MTDHIDWDERVAALDPSDRLVFTDMFRLVRDAVEAARQGRRIPGWESQVKETFECFSPEGIELYAAWWIWQTERSAA